MPALYSFAVKTTQQVHDDIVRTIKAQLQLLGIATPNVAPGSDFDVIAWAVATEISVGLANQTIMADQLMPDTAAGPNLDRWLTLFGLSRRPAIPANGPATFQASVPSVLIASDSQAVDSAGLLFNVITGGTYPTGAPIPFIAAQGGAATNHNNGDVLRWVTAPPYCAQTLTVGVPGGSTGFAGGADSEVGVDEPPRSRLYQLLQSPPKGGNSQDIAAFATASSPSVQGCAVYPALQGPGTAFFAVWGRQQTTPPFTATSMSRQLLSSLVNGTIVPYVQASLPEYVYLVGSPTVDQPTDVSLLLSLPSAPTASPPGPGGGWVDGAPWPSSVSGLPCTVTAITNSTTFTVNATTPPIPGATHIAYISTVNWQLYTANVLSFTGTSGAYVLTIDTPWPNLAAEIGTLGAVGIFPQAVQQQKYLAAMLGAFGQMGPGEWTANANVITRAFRHPPQSLAWPYQLNANFLRAMENAGPEVLSASFLYTFATTPTVPATITTNAAGQLTSTPPAIITPQRLGWYAQ